MTSLSERYLDDAGVPILLELEVVLTDLTKDVLTKFRIHLEYWNKATDELLDETATPEDVDDDTVVPALRVRFDGAYDIEEDEFSAETYFASPPVDDAIRILREIEYPGAVLAAGVGRHQFDSLLVADVHCGTQVECDLRDGRTRDRDSTTHSAAHRPVPPRKDGTVDPDDTLSVCTGTVRPG